MPKLRVLFVLNRLSAGTGPYQRAVRLDNAQFETVILSCYDTTEELIDKARLLGVSSEGKQLIGLGKRNRLACALALGRFILDFRPDVIQVNHTFSSIVAPLYGRLLRGCKTVRFEGTMFSRYHPLKRTMLACCHSLSDGAIVVSHAIDRINPLWGGLLERGKRREVIYNGVDIAELDGWRGSGNRSAWGLADDDFVIGHVGSLQPTKDVATLIRAFARLADRAPQAQLLLVGGGPLEYDLKRLAKQLNVEQRVVFTGAVERRDVYTCLDVMDLFAFPTHIEGLSEALVQAMCFGLPAVVSDISPNLEVVDHGVHGLTFPKGNVAALTERLLQMHDDRALRQQCGHAARRRVEESFDIYKIVQQYQDFYRQMAVRKAA